MVDPLCRETMPTEAHWCAALLQCVSSHDTVLCAERLLLQCPWALCEPSITPDIATHGGLGVLGSDDFVPPAALQRTVNVSPLSGVQALDKFSLRETPW